MTADAAYGFSKVWRFELEQADVFHIMATTRHDTVVTRWAIDHPVNDLFPSLLRQKRKCRSYGAGAHGRRIYDWARVEIRPWHRWDRPHWVLARRSVSRPEGSSYCGPDHAGRADPHCRQPIGGGGVLPDGKAGMRPLMPGAVVALGAAPTLMARATLLLA